MFAFMIKILTAARADFVFAGRVHTAAFVHYALLCQYTVSEKNYFVHIWCCMRELGGKEISLGVNAWWAVLSVLGASCTASNCNLPV